MTPQEREVLSDLLGNYGTRRVMDDVVGAVRLQSDIIAFVDSITSAPPWTSEAPTMAGDYRWRRDERSYYTFRRIVAGLDGSVFVDHGEDYDDPLELGGQWSGPLPEPEPKEE